MIPVQTRTLKTSCIISLNYAIKILKNVSPNAFSEKGEKIRLSILNKLGNEQIKHVENDEIISYPDLILKMESDMAELSGEDLAELAGHLGINVNYEGDSMFLFKCDHDDEDLGTAGLSFIDDDFEGQPDWRYKNILIK